MHPRPARDTAGTSPHGIKTRARNLVKSPSLNRAPYSGCNLGPRFVSLSNCDLRLCLPSSSGRKSWASWPRVKGQRVSYIQSCSWQGCGKPWGWGWGSGQGCFLGTENKAAQKIRSAECSQLQAPWWETAWQLRKPGGTWILTELFPSWGALLLRISLGSPCICQGLTAVGAG